MDYEKPNGDEPAKTDPDESVAKVTEEKESASVVSAPQQPTNQSYNEDLFDRRRRWGKGIQVYRLVNGKFQTKEADEEIKKQQ